jgi:hypothetical protein
VANQPACEDAKRLRGAQRVVAPAQPTVCRVRNAAGFNPEITPIKAETELKQG